MVYSCLPTIIESQSANDLAWTLRQKLEQQYYENYFGQRKPTSCVMPFYQGAQRAHFKAIWSRWKELESHFILHLSGSTTALRFLNSSLSHTYHNTITNSRSREWSLISNRSPTWSFWSSSSSASGGRRRSRTKKKNQLPRRRKTSFVRSLRMVTW